MEDYSLYILSAGLEVFFGILSLILLTGCLFDHTQKHPTSKFMIGILLLNALMNFMDAAVWIWCDVPSLLPVIKILSFLSYAFGFTIILFGSFLMVNYVRESTPVSQLVDRALIVYGVFSIFLWLLSLFNGMYYYWDENGICQLGNLYWLSQLMGILCYLFNLGFILYYRKTLSVKDGIILFFYNLLPLLSYFLIPYWEVTPFYMAITISLLLYYIVIHVDHGRRLAEQEVLLVKQELELTNSRTAILLTQVRPHFLYNSLTGIAQLCEKNPKLAKETTLNFSEYLRMNMKALDQKYPIPFETELKHVKSYLAIEQVRLGDALQVIYSIQATNFRLPALTLEPIVENAVKHGVGMKEDGGWVSISTRETDTSYVVVIQDNGVGFDVQSGIIDNHQHIGIRLVKIRLEALAHGSIQIESQLSVGTTVTIQIPKEIPMEVE